MPAASSACTLWVLAPSNDPGRALLADLPPDVRPVFGDSPAAFTGAAPADALLVCGFGRDALRAVLDLSPGVRWIHSRSAGVDALLYPELADRPVVVTNGRGVFGPALSEFVTAAVYYFEKDVGRLLAQQRERRWAPYSPGLVCGSVMGLVGYGDIGRAVAARAAANGMTVLTVRRSAGGPDGTVAEMLPRERLPEMLRRSDFIVLCAPLTPDTRGLIGADELRAMRESAVLVNVGRGALVQEDALVAALRDRRIRGAALDVFAMEPLPPEHPLWTLDNVLLSPHCADQVPGWLEGSVACFKDNLQRFLAGRPLSNVVDVRRGY